MSYEKHVYPAVLPNDPIREWRNALREQGLEVVFHPLLTDLTWEGGYLPCKMTVAPGAFATSSRYGDGPIRAGFELTTVVDAQEKEDMLDDYTEELQFGGKPLPPSLLVRLRAAPAMFAFTHGGFSWSVAEFRLCWFALQRWPQSPVACCLTSGPRIAADT